MLWKPISIVSFFTLLSTAAICQKADSLNVKFLYKNSVNTEINNAIIYSFNYERVLLNGRKFKTTGQVGMAFYPPPWTTDFCVPVIINELLSFNKHHIEVGLGYVYFYASSDYSNDFIYDYFKGKIGYRFQKPNGRFTTKIGFTPYFKTGRYGPALEFYPAGEFSFGYNFGKN